eukprot:COSAG01_NODE_2618_length_7371_cov_13.342959_2_plen_91_part_00
MLTCHTQLRAVLRARHQPYMCDVEGCGYTCGDTSSLRRHKLIHTGEKPFHCDWPGCTYATARSGCGRSCLCLLPRVSLTPEHVRTSPCGQ